MRHGSRQIELSVEGGSRDRIIVGNEGMREVVT